MLTPDSRSLGSPATTAAQQPTQEPPILHSHAEPVRKPDDHPKQDVPVMGYDKWENFLRVIDRAVRAAENTNTYSEQSFSRLRENVPGAAPRGLTSV